MAPLQSGIGLPTLGKSAPLTASTTQTQAAATVWPAASSEIAIVKVTTAVANDGIALPRADFPNAFGSWAIVENLSANILKVHPFYTSAATNEDGSAFGATINGGAANTFFSQAASSTYAYILNAKNTWVAHKLS